MLNWCEVALIGGVRSRETFGHWCGVVVWNVVTNLKNKYKRKVH